MIAVAALLLAAGTIASSAATNNAVIVARIDFVQPLGIGNLEHDRAFYSHETFQYFVVSVERDLAANSTPRRILVGVRLLSTSELDSHGEATGCRFDPKRWKRGSRVIMSINTTTVSDAGCTPATVGTSVSEPAGHRAYLDDTLQQYRELPVYCSVASDVFLVQR